jgi:hypothetical protein
LYPFLPYLTGTVRLLSIFNPKIRDKALINMGWFLGFEIRDLEKTPPGSGSRGKKSKHRIPGSGSVRLASGHCIVHVQVLATVKKGKPELRKKVMPAVVIR